jgi:methylated-DNA-[protein]-cysteine S-methyltransferase
LDKSVVLLKKYFSGERALFDLPLDLGYYTPFQQAVWRAAMKITSGETRSYAWIAQKIKRPRAARAVGQAMGANPVPIIIP